MYKKLKLDKNLCNCVQHVNGLKIKYLNQKCDCDLKSHDKHKADCKCSDQSSKKQIVKCDWRMHSHYICNRHFCLNLAGLTDSLNFKLLSKRRRPIEIGTIMGASFHGKSKYVGIDYLDIKENDSTVVTILKDKIKFIKIK